MSEVSVEIVGLSEKREHGAILEAILKIQAAAYPPSWLYQDGEEYFRDALASKEAINILVRYKGNIVGHVLAVPLRSVLVDIVPYDSGIVSANPNAYYIDTIAALPRRGFSSLRRVMFCLNEELVLRHIPTLTMHARVLTGLSRIMQSLFSGRIVSIRRIESWKWYDYEEPTDFIEVSISKQSRGR